VIWLFAAKELSDYTTWSQRIREVVPKSQVWIQTGSVSAAVQIAGSAKPDVLCVQGNDAGGHGYEKGASLITLLPEIADALASAGHGHIPLIAAGGISDSRSAAAAFALGAQGVVMGTRFLSSPEAQVHDLYRKAIVASSDGGQATVRDKVFDELWRPNVWPIEYDGRCIVSASFRDHVAGKDIEEIRRLHAEAQKGEHKGFAVDGSGRAAMWAGTGVGLVKREQPAAEIVEEVRQGVEEVFEEVRARL
jgi:nitronate monooxygenase